MVTLRTFHDRPISILSAIPKLFEYLVTKPLTAAISHLIMQEQEAYVEEKSTVITASDFLVTSGIPHQGSHLGQVLFIIFINNASNCCKYVLFLIFADDIKMFLTVY